MAKITGQLKAFARKSPLRLGPVSVRRVLGNVQALLEQRLRTEAIAMTRIGRRTTCWCGPRPTGWNRCS